MRLILLLLLNGSGRLRRLLSRLCGLLILCRLFLGRFGFCLSRSIENLGDAADLIMLGKILEYEI